MWDPRREILVEFAWPLLANALRPDAFIPKILPLPSLVELASHGFNKWAFVTWAFLFCIPRVDALWQIWPSLNRP